LKSPFKVLCFTAVERLLLKCNRAFLGVRQFTHDYAKIPYEHWRNIDAGIEASSRCVRYGAAKAQLQPVTVCAFASTRRWASSADRQIRFKNRPPRSSGRLATRLAITTYPG